jgi:hypothetical protein
VRRLAKALAAALGLLVVAPAFASAAPERRVLIAVVPPAPSLAAELARFADSGLGQLGLMTASVDVYSEQQTLLDITQGARVPPVGYSPSAAPALALTRTGAVIDWAAIVRRAAAAGARLAPGALAAAVDGGAGYVGGSSVGEDGALAAGRHGRIGAVSLGPKVSLAARVRKLLARKRLVVAQLAGAAQLRSLLAARARGELVLALEAPPVTAPGATRAPLLLALGASGLRAGAGALTSGSTRSDGLVAATDLAATVLSWLRLREPAAIDGQPLRVGAARTVAALAAYARRLAVVGGRRVTVLVWVALTWLSLLVLAVVRGRGLQATLALGGLAALWAPVLVLLGALLEPGGAAEGALVAGGSFALALASERIASWPRAAAVPAIVTLVLYGGDLLAGSGLVERSVLGSDPISGSRYFGAGNELATVLMVELLVAIAALAPRRLNPMLLSLGGALVLVLAWGRAGANVGAIFTLGGAVAVAGGLSARRVILAGGGIVAALGVLAVVDLLSGGGAQLASEVLRAGALERRASETWHAFVALPAGLVALGVWLLAVRLCWGARERLPRPWAAGVAGMLAGALLGSLAADSGPRVLLIGCGGAACALAYLAGGDRELLMRPLVAVRTLQSGSGIPRPDPPKLLRR